MHVTFEAAEYHADQTVRPARFAFDGSEAAGWTITRNDAVTLRLGPGYRLLRTEQCGVCSTDLARHLLPFGLPQVTGHEVVARDEDDRRYVVEINASHRALGLSVACAFCDAGLPTHCPERLVLGIDRLPGGFGPWMLVPRRAALPVPDRVPTGTAVLIEPLAAALHGVDTIAPRAGQTVAVLGPRRLGLLAVAALRAYGARHGVAFEVLALSRHERLLDLARRLGATATERVVGDGADLPAGLADVVVDTTGHPSGLELAVRLARAEVHLKSTHGQPAAGVAHLTELVVDELAIARLEASPPAGLDGTRVAWLSSSPRPDAWSPQGVAWCEGDSAADCLARLEKDSDVALPRADAAVVDDAAQVAAAIRPRSDQAALVRPRGEILVHPAVARGASSLLDAVATRGLRLSSSRCGDFGRALELVAGDPELCRLGERFVTHRFGGAAIGEALATARDAACIKAVVEHADA